MRAHPLSTIVSAPQPALPAFYWDDYLDSLHDDPSSVLDCWEYADVAVDITSLKAVTDVLNDLGSQGWEVVSTTAFANIPGNKLMVLAKRRILSPPPPDNTLAAWHDDPTGRFDKRYWDGRFWSVHVGNAHPKMMAKDPPTMLPPPVMGDEQ